MSTIARQSQAICLIFSLFLSACNFDQFVDAIDEDGRVTCDVLEHRDGVLEAIRMTAANNGFTFYDGPVPEDRTQIVVSMDHGPAAVEIRNSGLGSIWINSSVISLSETDTYDGKDIDLVVEELVAAIEDACEA
jgi:hypothetical protein